MEKKVSLRNAVFCVLLVALVVFMTTFIGMAGWMKSQVYEEAKEAGSTGYPELDEVISYFDNLYVGEFDKDEIYKYLIAGYIAGTGDKYAQYYDDEGFAELHQDLNGEMQGIGVSVIYNADYKAIEIIDVFNDSPAMAAGVEVGDLIVFVGADRESVAEMGYDAALKKLQGTAGTTADFVVLRGDDYGTEIEFSVERDSIKEQTVSSRICSLDATVGIIKISSFDSATVGQFKDAVESLKEDGAEKLIFDVRNNPGGELNSICSILDYLLPEGPIMKAVDKNGEEEARTSDASELDMPMAVLTNSNTASAAELFSCALKDYEKAVLVGTVTYGKGCMQTIFPLSTGGGLSITTAMYYPPFSDNYDGVGVTPNIEVELSGDAASKSLYKLTDEEDTQLCAAVKALSENAASD